MGWRQQVDTLGIQTHITISTEDINKLNRKLISVIKAFKWDLPKLKIK
jgi:hypothetical protein